MKSDEAGMTTKLNNYLREKKFYCYYEMKFSGGATFSFGNIRKCQWEGLQAAERNGFIWKLSDETSRPKPFDGFSTPPLPAYLVVFFHRVGFFFIRFNKIVAMREDGAISISRSKAQSIAEKIIQI